MWKCCAVCGTRASHIRWPLLSVGRLRFAAETLAPDSAHFRRTIRKGHAICSQVGGLQLRSWRREAAGSVRRPHRVCRRIRATRGDLRAARWSAEETDGAAEAVADRLAEAFDLEAVEKWRALGAADTSGHREHHSQGGCVHGNYHVIGSYERVAAYLDELSQVGIPRRRHFLSRLGTDVRKFGENVIPLVRARLDAPRTASFQAMSKSATELSDPCTSVFPLIDARQGGADARLALSPDIRQAERRRQHAVASENHQHQNDHGKRQHLHHVGRNLTPATCSAVVSDRLTPNNKAPSRTHGGFPAPALRARSR